MNKELPPFIRNEIIPKFDKMLDDIAAMKSTCDYISVDEIVSCIIDCPQEREKQWKSFCSQWVKIIHQIEGIAAILQRKYGILPDELRKDLLELLDDETKAALKMILCMKQCIGSKAESTFLIDFRLNDYLFAKIDYLRMNEGWCKQVFEEYAHKLPDAKLPCASSDVIQKMIEKVVSFITTQ